MQALLDGRRISGSHAVSLLSLKTRTILLVGEIHENPGPCSGGDAADVLDDLVLPLWREDGALVLVEGFPGEKIVQGSGHLSRLRRFARGRERFLLFDARHALGMASPFEPSFRAEHVPHSLRAMHRLPEFLFKNNDPRWQRQRRQFESLVAEARSRPSVARYHAIFMAVPDLVALSMVLGTRHRTVVVYAGDRHRQQLETWLVEEYGARVVTRSQDLTRGSCSVPQPNQKSSAASRLWRWMRRMP